MKKALSLFLSLVLIVGIIPAAQLDLRVSAAIISCIDYFAEGDYSSNQGQYVANIAKAQLGKDESDLPYSYDWCSYFATDCAWKAGVASSVVPRRGYAHDLVEFFMTDSDSKVYFRQDSNYFNGSFLYKDHEPQPGDIIGVCNDGNYNSITNNNVDGNYSKRYCVDHIGLVWKVDRENGWIYTIEGNTSDAVNSYRYRWNNSDNNGLKEWSSTTYIQYVCHPNYQGSSIVTVPEGVYTIHNVRNLDKVLDIQYDSTACGANIQLYDNWCNQVQKFRVVSKGDYYCIQSVYSGMWLDTASPYNADGCNIQLWNTNTQTEQKWVFEDAGNGNVYIRSLYGVYLDTAGGSTDNSTNVETYHFDGTTSQQWKMVRVSESASISVEEGVYEIHNVRNPSRVMDIRWNSLDDFAVVQLYDDIDNKIEKFRIVKLGAYYGIQSVYSGKWLDIHAPVVGERNQTIQLYSSNANPEEKWVFEDAGNGNVLIRSLNDVYVDTESGATENSTPLKTFTYDGSTSQQWTLVKTTEQPTAILSVDESCCDNQTQVVFSFGGSNSGVYTLGLYKDGQRIEGLQVDGHTYTRVFSEPGEYSAYMTAYSYPDYADSNWVYWTVYDQTTAFLDINHEFAEIGENVTFSFSSHNSGNYILGIYKDGQRIQTISLVYGHEYSMFFTEAGNYSAYMTAFSNHIESADSNWVYWAVGTRPVITPISDSTIVDGQSHQITGLSVGSTATEFEKEFVSISGGSFEYEYPTAKQTMGTGTKVNVYNNDQQLVDSYTVVVFGDIDGNSWYDGTDAYFVRLVASGMIPSSALTDAQRAACDANHDGVIDEADTAIIERAGLLLNQIDQTLPQEELETNSVYLEYCGLIDQSIEITEPDQPTETDEPQPVAQSVLGWLKALFTVVLNWLLRVF